MGSAGLSSMKIKRRVCISALIGSRGVMLPILVAILGVGVAGCGTIQNTQSASSATISSSSVPNTLNAKPNWLLVGSVDVDQAHGGDEVGISSDSAITL